MGKLAPLSWEELVRRLRRLGFEGPYWGGRHPFMIRGDLVLVVPNPHRGDIGVEFLQRILRESRDISGGLAGLPRLIC